MKKMNKLGINMICNSEFLKEKYILNVCLSTSYR